MKFQKIIRAGVFGIVLVIISIINLRCSDEFLEQFPKDTASSTTFYGSEDEFELSINGAYKSLSRDNVDGNVFGFAPMIDCMTPYIARGSGSRYFGALDSRRDDSFNSTWKISKHFWSVYYKIIKHSNEVLDNMHKLSPTPALNRIKGEALFLRSLSYFYLTDFWGNVPLITSVQTLGNSQAVRTPKDQVIGQVITDLKEAITLLPSVTEYRSTKLLGRASKGAAQGLLGKVYVFEKRYAEAKVVLKELIDSGDYGLTPGPTGYNDQFWPAGDNNIESIFEIQYGLKSGLGHGLGSGMSPDKKSKIHTGSGSGRSKSINPREMLIDLYETTNGYKVKSTFVKKSGRYIWKFSYSCDDPEFDPENSFDNRDPRLRWTAWYENTPYIQEFEAKTGQSGVNFKSSYAPDSNHAGVKYMVGNTYDITGKDSEGNYKVMRYADILLLYAEALLEDEGEKIEAARYINMVRSRVGMPDVAMGTLEEMRTSLREERIRELACEYGHIYQDLRRWGTYKQAMTDFWSGENYGYGEKYDFEFGSDNILWPIPQTEIDLNVNILK